MAENNNQTEELDINHLMQIRREKLSELTKRRKRSLEITKFVEQIQQEK